MIWIEKKDAGGWDLLLIADFMAALAGLPQELRQLLEKGDFSDQVVSRLFPQAYPKDPQAEAEYQRLLRQDFVQSKLEGIECFEKSLVRQAVVANAAGIDIVRIELEEEELALWLGFFHDVRLMIATRLGIADDSWEKEIDPGHPHARELAMLHDLGFFEERIVKALREAEKLDFHRKDQEPPAERTAD